MARKKKITIVNDHPEFLALMTEFLAEEGYDVTAIPKGSRISAATLTLNVTNPSSGAGFAVYPLLRA